MDNLSYCRNYLEKHDPEIYYCLAKESYDDLIIGLFQLNLELAKISQNSGENTISFLKLSWWQEVIEQCYKKDSEEKEHPTILLLKNLIKKYKIAKKDLDILVTAREFDAKNEKVSDWQEYQNYIDKYLYQIFKIICESNKISLTKKQQQSLKNLCYILKTIRVIHSLPKRNYNDHPFVTIELIEEVRNEPTIHKQEAIIAKLKQYIKDQRKGVSEFDKEQKFLRNFQNMVNYLADKTIKYSSSRSIACINPIKLKFYLWRKA